jgi:hypothetical protein
MNVASGRTLEAISISTEDSAWKLATMATLGKVSKAHRKTVSGAAPAEISAGAIMP